MTILAFGDTNSLTKWPIGLSDLRDKFPNTTFNKTLVAANLTDFGVVEVEEEDVPSFTSSQYIKEKAPVFASGKWSKGWEVVDYTTSELTAIEDGKKATQRENRNKLLAESDWTASSDLTMSDDWKTYRQALRDVPAQSGFPNTISWPTKPS
tara:strand:+ start:796 stop:1251 length:456 start_codon:yes stop_codon:yes gene_type:complete